MIRNKILHKLYGKNVQKISLCNCRSFYSWANLFSKVGNLISHISVVIMLYISTIYIYIKKDFFSVGQWGWLYFQAVGWVQIYSTCLSVWRMLLPWHLVETQGSGQTTHVPRDQDQKQQGSDRYHLSYWETRWSHNRRYGCRILLQGQREEMGTEIYHRSIPTL